MRVVFLSSAHGPLDKRVFAKEACALAKAGYDVIHLAPGNGEAWSQDGVRIVSYSGGGGLVGRVSRLFGLYRKAKRLDADVYHCNEVDSWVVGIALRLMRRRRCVFDVHEHYPEEFAEKRFPMWARALVRALVSGSMSLLAVKTDRIVLAKRSLEPAFRKYASDKVWLVQNFAPAKAFPESARAGGQENKCRLVHLGLINRYRGWPELLDGLARAKCTDTELLVIGTINDGSGSEFWKSVQRLDLSGRVQMEEWLPYADAMERVAASDIGVICFQPGFFNHEHALPHKLFDYMGASLPVIAPGVSIEVSEIVTNADCGILVDTSDPDSIANAIDQLCLDRPMARAMGQRGHAAILSRYNWEAEAETLVTMYRGLEEIVRCAG